MKYLLVILILFSIAFAGDLATLHQQMMPTETEDTSEQNPNLPEGVGLAPGIKLIEPTLITDPGIDEIGIERTRCLSSCPAYTLVIQKDGSFRYTGEYGVERMGEHTGKVSVGQLKQVMRFMNETLFFGLESSYTSPFLDGASTYTMARKGEVKVIENYAGSGPATLWAIEQLIDALLETAEWDE
jgi:hypothetical protein